MRVVQEDAHMALRTLVAPTFLILGTKTTLQSRMVQPCILQEAQSDPHRSFDQSTAGPRAWEEPHRNPNRNPFQSLVAPETVASTGLQQENPVVASLEAVQVDEETHREIHSVSRSALRSQSATALETQEVESSSWDHGEVRLLPVAGKAYVQD